MMTVFHDGASYIGTVSLPTLTPTPLISLTPAAFIKKGHFGEKKFKNDCNERKIHNPTHH
jgi:hypothetical protein